MDLGTMLRVMIKRWFVSLPALVMAIALPVGAWFSIPAKYQSTSTISLLNSAAASSAAGRTGNPFTAFDNSLTPMADFLARRLSSDQSMADLAGKGVTDIATAELAPNASGPFLTLTVTGKDESHVLAEMQTFDQYTVDQLAAIQNSTATALPTATLIRAVVVVPPQKPTTSMKTKFEDVAGAAVAGLVLLFVAVFGAEALAVRRGQKPSRTPVMPRRRNLNGDAGRDDALGAIAGDGFGSLARRAPAAPASSSAETTISLPRYRDPDFEDEPDAEPWLDIEPVPLEHFPLEDFAVGDRDSGAR